MSHVHCVAIRRYGDATGLIGEWYNGHGFGGFQIDDLNLIGRVFGDIGKAMVRRKHHLEATSPRRRKARSLGRIYEWQPIIGFTGFG